MTTGNVAVVYPHQGKTPAHGVVYWDPGGPGQQPLDGGAARQALPEWADPYDLVLIAEPWTYLEPDPQCAEVLTQAGVTGVPRNDAPNFTSCNWSDWRLDETEIRDAAAEVDATIGKIAGVYAESFGAVRSRPAMRFATARGGFVVLDSPAPAPSVTGAVLLAKRWRLTLDAVVDVPNCSDSCVATRRNQLTKFLNGTDQLSAQEAGLGLMGLAPRLQENADFLANFWADDTRLSRIGLLSWQKTANAFDRSNSAGEPQPDLVSYVASICHAYSDWPTQPGNALEAMHAICSQAAVAGHFDPGGRTDGRLFLALNDRDTVVPVEEQRTWADKFSSTTLRHYSVRGHVSAPPRVAAQIAGWIRSNS